MASPGRFERLTYRLGGGRSIQLSYGDICFEYRIITFTAVSDIKLFLHSTGVLILYHRKFKYSSIF